MVWFVCVCIGVEWRRPSLIGFGFRVGLMVSCVLGMVRELLVEQVGGERIFCGFDQVGYENFVELTLENFLGLPSVEKSWLSCAWGLLKYFTNRTWIFRWGRAILGVDAGIGAEFRDGGRDGYDGSVGSAAGG